jgi:hypothetical protein
MVKIEVVMAPTIAERLSKTEDTIEGPGGLSERLVRIETTVIHHEAVGAERHRSVIERLDKIATTQEAQDSRLWKIVLGLLTAAGLGGAAPQVIEILGK